MGVGDKAGGRRTTHRTTRRTTVVVVGGGHSGLAMSRQLSERGIDHVVLERGEVAQSWRTQRWDSFTLLTPNWQNRLPGLDYTGDDPDGFMTGAEIAAFIGGYADTIDAPIETGTTVTAVRAAALHTGHVGNAGNAGRAGHADHQGYEVETDQGPWHCRCVVLAGGACNLPSVPEFAAAVPDGVEQMNPLDYRSPDQLADGGVLIVGAAATGVQLADEIHASGRPVTLSVGEHVRMPRTYRGRDIQHWMEAIGRLEERYDEVEEIRKARGVASPQLIGTPEHRTLDLNRLTDAGVRLRGRLGGIRDGVAMFSGGLRNHCTLADLKLGRLLDEIDEWIDGPGRSHDQDHDRDDTDTAADTLAASERHEATRVERGAPLTLDLAKGEIATIVWATGFRPDLSWVELPVFDPRGRLRHDGGVVTDAPGVYTLGSTFLRRRKSSFIHGAADDSRDLAEHLAGYLAGSG